MPVISFLVYSVFFLVLSGGVAGLFSIAFLNKNISIKKWLLFWTIFNGCAISFLYGNWLDPLSWFGKISYILLLISLLIVFSSLFLIYHEVVSKHWLSGWKKLAFNAVTLWSIIGIFFLLVEVFFRIFFVYDTLALNPGVKFFWPDYVYFPLNNFGYRDRDFTFNKNSHTYRIMTVGDSFTEGNGRSRKETFSGVLEQELNRRLASTECDDKVEVYNLGVSGANTVEEVEVVLKKAPMFKPDLIILAYFFNDPENHPHDLKTFDPPPWVAQVHKIFLEKVHSYAYYWFFTKFTVYRGPISTMVDYYKAIHRLNYSGWGKTCEAMSQLGRFIKENNIDFIGLIFPLFDKKMYSSGRLKQIHEQVYRMITERDLEVVDLYPFFDNINGNFSVFAFSPQDGHPNRYAHDLLGHFLSEMIWQRDSFTHFRETCSPTKKDQSLDHSQAFYFDTYSMQR